MEAIGESYYGVRPNKCRQGVNSEPTKCQLLRIPTYGLELFVLNP
jgi:hypothetical protein